MTEPSIYRFSDLTVFAMGEIPGDVEFALNLLERYCREVLAVSVRRAERFKLGGSGLLLVVGRQAVEKVAEELLIPLLLIGENLGMEGYILRVSHALEQICVIAAGNTWSGTRHAVLEFLNRIEIRYGQPGILSDLSIRETPSYRKRGIYAHQHWAYSYPYALRTWPTEDWKKYVDMLALLHANFFEIWSMAGICPVPLSERDEAFLRRYPPVIDHARENHGFEVWIGECANNVCLKQDVPIMEERLYFDVEEKVDPATEEGMEAIRKSREVFYEICSNADGYWIIDSDPGGYDGSSASEFISILERNREWIDRLTEKGREAVLTYWMWMSWGNGSREENLREALREMQQRVREPWNLHLCWDLHFQIAQELGVPLEKGIYCPYGALEPEPSLPFTLVIPDHLVKAVQARAHQAGSLGGTLGNAQTPLVQLPDLYYFLRSAWNVERAGDDRGEILGELAGRLFPENASLLKEAWLSLGSPDAPEFETLAEELEHAVRDGLGLPGPLGWLLFPDGKTLFRDLALQLRIHGQAMRFCRLVRECHPDEERLLGPLIEYHVLSVEWRKRHGFRLYPNNGYDYYPLRQAVQDRWMDGDSIRADVYRRLWDELESRFGTEEAEFNLMPIHQVMPR